MTKKELEDYLWGAANILRGMIDAADFKQYIFPLLFFKRISDVWDEEYKTALEESNNDLDYALFQENHRFQIPKGCHWDEPPRFHRSDFYLSSAASDRSPKPV